MLKKYLPSEHLSQLLMHLHYEVKNQTILIWNYKGMQTLPESLIQEASHVKQIYLKHNLLKHLPDNLGCLQNLTFLYLYGNCLEELPDSIGSIETLQILDVSNNKLKNLPKSITKLKSLRSLVASNNEIVSIPFELCKLSMLSLLILTGNRLTRLPDSLGKMKALQGIYVDNNFLTSLPPMLVALPVLAHLSCCNNDLIYLPMNPFLCKPTIFFDNNPQLNYIPFGILTNLKVGDSFDPYVVPSCGCFVQDTPVVQNGILLDYEKLSSDSSTVVIPAQFHKLSFFDITYSRLNPPPLSELCLRYLWKEKTSRLKSTSPGTLPSHLIHILKDGPIAFCEFCQASTVFTYASIIAITISITSQTGIPGMEIPSLLFFCNDMCALHFSSLTTTYSDQYGIWLRKSLSSQLRIKMSNQ